MIMFGSPELVQVRAVGASLLCINVQYYCQKGGVVSVTDCIAAACGERAESDNNDNNEFQCSDRTHGDSKVEGHMIFPLVRDSRGRCSLSCSALQYRQYGVTCGQREHLSGGHQYVLQR